MLTELCQYLKNWFDREHFHGKFTITDGSIDLHDHLQSGQYFRIIGSVFNDGVHQYPSEELTDETFVGTIWAMAVPPLVIELSADIDDWIAKYGGTDSAAMSPYQSESFGGYSYSKSGGGASDGTSLAGTWQGVFASRLNRWRKI